MGATMTEESGRTMIIQQWKDEFLGRGPARILGRICCFTLVIALAIPSAGCNREGKRKAEEDLEKFKTEEAEAGPIRRPLNVGESIVAEFATDGLWHPLPYAALNGQVLRLDTFGETRNYGDNLVEFKLGNRTMVVNNGREFVSSDAGAFAVRVQTKRVPGLGPSAQVQITRVK